VKSYLQVSKNYKLSYSFILKAIFVNHKQLSLLVIEGHFMYRHVSLGVCVILTTIIFGALYDIFDSKGTYYLI